MSVLWAFHGRSHGALCEGNWCAALANARSCATFSGAVRDLRPPLEGCDLECDFGSTVSPCVDLPRLVFLMLQLPSLPRSVSSRMAAALMASVSAVACHAPVFAQGANLCADAQYIKGYGSYAFNTAGATTDGAADALCLFSSQSNIFNDVWFRFVAPETFVVEVTNCSASSLDSKIAIYADSCAGPVIACSDDNCALQTRVSFAATAGATYLIRVGSYSSAATGSGTLTVSRLPLLGDVTDKATGQRYVAVAATTWTAAEALGVTLGGHLVSIGDSAEQEFVWQNFRTLGGIDRRIWIGFSDQSTEGVFEWSDGTPAKYTNWNAGEPNNSGNVEDYAEMLGSTGKWNDLNNTGSGYPHIAVIELSGGGGGGPSCPADLDGDQLVTAADLSLLLANWGGLPDFDISGDGVVDAADLSLLLAAWGECPL